MRQLEVNVTDAARFVGFSGLRDLMLALQTGRINKADVDRMVDEGVATGKIRTHHEGEGAEPGLPITSPMEGAFMDASEGDKRSPSEERDLAASGATHRFDRLLTHAIADVVNTGLHPRASRWAALNRLANDTGELGVVARAVRLGWVHATMAEAERHGTDEEKLRLRELRGWGKR